MALVVPVGAQVVEVGEHPPVGPVGSQLLEVLELQWLTRRPRWRGDTQWNGQTYQFYDPCSFLRMFAGRIASRVLAKLQASAFHNST